MRNQLAALAMLLMGSTAAAAPTPHLVPIDRDFTVFASYPGMHAYQLAVRDALLGRSDRRAWEAIVIPSFEREWAIHVQKHDGADEVVLTVMQEQLWGRMLMAAMQTDGSIPPGDEVSALKRVSRETWRASAPLSRTTARLLEQTWAAMLFRAQQPPEPAGCLDGTSYYVFQLNPNGGSRGGWGRCPQSDTPTAALLVIVKDLREAAGSSGQALMRLDMAIAQKATRLIRTLL